MLKIAFTLLFIFSTSSFAADLSTYQDFGEKPGLTKVVDDLMVNLLANEKTRPFFEKADQVHIKEKLVEQFCVQIDGPCTYTGQTMKKAHKGHDIDTSEFYALVEALQESMNKNKIPQRAQNKLLAKLAPMHKDIINK
ncbi:MAG: group 1 truncated hemoglobin [Rhizobacter sp.]|nr:group 1 truncated hemoglobin [Bacteriovorax sp.]